MTELKNIFEFTRIKIREHDNTLEPKFFKLDDKFVLRIILSFLEMLKSRESFFNPFYISPLPTLLPAYYLFSPLTYIVVAHHK